MPFIRRLTYLSFLHHQGLTSNFIATRHGCQIFSLSGMSDTWNAVQCNEIKCHHSRRLYSTVSYSVARKNSWRTRRLRIFIYVFVGLLRYFSLLLRLDHSLDMEFTPSFTRCVRQPRPLKRCGNTGVCMRLESLVTVSLATREECNC